MERKRVAPVLRFVLEAFQGVAVAEVLYQNCEHVAGQNGVQREDVVQDEQIFSVSASHFGRHICSHYDR